jgi:tetraacyldisaccharide 4'-kinase
VIATLYAAAARRRREWYASRPHLRKRLRHPVISIGNIAAGGRGKTPFTATVARLLMDLGERPAILSRGYRRAAGSDDVVVVRDREGIRADLARSGDEPFMLARQLEGAIVVSGPDRYAGGRLAEERLGATVHVLDDGFQHFKLDRDLDIVLVAAGDLKGGPTLPTGHLREPADVLVAADAIVAVDDVVVEAPHAAVFRARRDTEPVIFDANARPAGHNRVFAVAGIANPEAFFSALAADVWQVAGTRTFRDHHAYSAQDVAAIFAAARQAGAGGVVTTEKDYVRLLPHRPFALPVGWLPLTMKPEPADEFRRWLATGLGAARDSIIG